MTENQGLQEQALCTFRWSYPIYYMFDQSIAYCCRTPAQYLDEKSVEKYGSEVFTKMDYFQSRRQEMLQGSRHSDCDSCWQLERNGIKSPRNSDHLVALLKKAGHISQSDSFVDAKASPEKQATLKQKSVPDILEIVLSNTCNAKCVYCSEYYSSAWRAENKAQGISPKYADKVRNKKNDDLFWKWVRDEAVSSVHRIGFIGGEPLLIPELYECLDRLDEIFPEYKEGLKPEICLTTNFSIPQLQFENFLESYDKLKDKFKLVIQISIEAPKEQTEYIRFGTKWDLIQSNLRKLNSRFPQVDILFLPTLNILAVPTLADFIEYIKVTSLELGRPIRIFSNTVTDPDFLNPMALPESFGKFVIEALTKLEQLIKITNDPYTLEGYQKYHSYLVHLHTTILRNSDFNPHLQLNFRNYFKRLDIIRKTSFTQTFPDLVNLI